MKRLSTFLEYKGVDLQLDETGCYRMTPEFYEALIDESRTLEFAIEEMSKDVATAFYAGLGCMFAFVLIAASVAYFYLYWGQCGWGG